MLASSLPKEKPSSSQPWPWSARGQGQRRRRAERGSLHAAQDSATVVRGSHISSSSCVWSAASQLLPKACTLSNAEGLSVCLSAGEEASPCSQKKGDLRVIPGQKTPPPGRRPCCFVDHALPTGAISAAMRRPPSTVLPTHLSVTPSVIVFSPQGLPPPSCSQ